MISRFQIPILILLVLLGVGRIASTYKSVGLTYDEPWHVAGGMEWLQFHTYTYEPMHPPLSRVAQAIGPYFAGARLSSHRDIAKEGGNALFQQGDEIYYDDHSLSPRLMYSRWGTLPFFVITAVVLFLWGRRWFSVEIGLLAVGLLICTPPILAHAGLATNDMACAAGTLVALYQLLRWVEQGSGFSWPRTLWLGAALGFALLCKFSAILFLAGCCAMLAIVFWRQRVRVRAQGFGTPPPQPNIRAFLTAAAIALIFLWAGYQFSLRPLESVWGPHPKLDAAVAAHPALKPIVNAAFSVPIPLSEFIVGVRDVSRHNVAGHDSYLLGEYRNSGWWYFFLVVLAVKTPIGLLLLAAGGFLFIRRAPASLREPKIPQIATAWFPLVILATTLVSQIDLGVRHILPIYPLLALLAADCVISAYAVFVRTPLSRAILNTIPAVLLIWVVIDSVKAHPDYLAYFNQLAGPHPEHVLAESDLDWGQDLEQLGTRLTHLEAQDVSIAYFGSALLHKSGLPTYHPLDPRNVTHGWVAISLHDLMIEHAKNGSYDWLKAYTPRERVGKSIDLFYIP